MTPVPQVRLTRAVEFSTSLRYWNPDLSEAENRERFGRKASRHGHNYRLEVTLVQSILCERILGIPAAALDAGAHLRYPRTTAAALAAVERGEAHAAFLVPAARLDVIKHLVEVGDVMPARATRMGPDVATGLVMRQIDPDEDLL